MRTIRRLYFYAVALISLEVVLWGVIGLLRSIFSSGVIDLADALAQALAFVLVGVPIFLFHWLWAQRAAAQNEEEQTASLRAIYFYTVLLATLVPVVQNLLALIDRSVLSIADLNVSRAVLGGFQTWQDNLIAILINTVTASYFWDALRKSWKSLPDSANFSDVRRLYRYLWTLYSLSMVVFGAQQILRFILSLPLPEDILGAVGQELFANGLALLVVGTPLWVYIWRICQEALVAPTERESNLRLGILYLLSLGGVITVLSAVGTFIDLVLRWLLGETFALSEFISRAGGPISLGLPLAGVWVYYGGWLKQQIQFDPAESGRAAKQRVYLYILSVVGLAATFVGIALLFSFVIDLTTSNVLWGETLRSRFSGAMATLLVGLPLWLSAWRPMQAAALSAGEAGDHARRSILRRSYLYLALFAGVIGGMVSAVWLVYTLINALLTQKTGVDFLSSMLNAVQLLVLFVTLLVYHLGCLRHDGERTSQTLGSRQREFPVLVMDAGDEAYLKSLVAALHKFAPEVPVTVQAVGRKPSKKAGEARAVIMPAALALDPPESLRKWLTVYRGEKIIVGQAVSGWVYQSLTPEQAGQCVQKLAEGEALQLARPSAFWETLKIVAVIWMGIQILFLLLSIGISLLAD